MWTMGKAKKDDFDDPGDSQPQCWWCGEYLTEKGDIEASQHLNCYLEAWDNEV